MQRYIVLFSGIFLMANNALAEPLPAKHDGQLQPASQPSIGRRPAMRVIERDWAYYQALGCKELAGAPAQTEHEQQWLKRRQQQCLRQLDAFFSKPVAR